MADEIQQEENVAEQTSQQEAVQTEQGSAPAPDAGADEWKAYSRHWEKLAKKSYAKEREAEAAQKRVADLETQLNKAAEASKTDQEKALDAARKEAAEQIKSEYEQQLRQERLQGAVARAAASKFADVDDAIRLLDDFDNLFDSDGKIDSKALTAALDDLLERKPHLAASPNGGKPAGDADAGKGSATDSDLEAMSVEEHFNAIKRNK